MAEACGIPEFENNESQADNIVSFFYMVQAAERERIAKKIEKLPFGDTSQSFAVWVRQDVP
jgi:hypothetical protein